MANTYHIYNSVTVLGTFETVATPRTNPPTYVAADPQTVTVTITDPSGAAVVFTYGVDDQLVRLAVGAYLLTFTPNLPHWWEYDWEGVGAAGSNQRGRILVLA